MDFWNSFMVLFQDLFTSAITSLTSSLTNFNNILRKIAPQDTTVSEIIARQRLLVEGRPRLPSL